MTALDTGVDSQKPWLWNVRGKDLIEYDGQVDGYLSVTANVLDGDVGDWSLVLPVSHWAVPVLLTEGSGVVARPAGQATVICSGPVTHDATVYSRDGNTVTFTGPTDEWILASEPAWPDPLHGLNDAAGGNVVSGHVDDRIGVAETVLLGYVRDNMGATAYPGTDGTPDRRRDSWLTIPASSGRGTTGEYQANFTQLLEIAKTICRTGGITYQLRQGASGHIAMTVRARADVSADVVFSQAEGSLDSATFSRTAPTVTQAITINDDGSARSYVTAVDSAAEALWGMRFVTTVDGSSAVIADAAAAAADAIAAGVETAGATLVPVILAGGPVFGVDYQLGDTVTVVDATGFSLTDQLVQIAYQHDASTPPTITPSVGLSATDETAALVPILRAIQARLEALRRRRP